MIPFLNTSRQSSSYNKKLVPNLAHLPFARRTLSSTLAEEAQNAELEQQIERIRAEFPDDAKTRRSQLAQYKSRLESGGHLERIQAEDRILAAQQAASSNRHMSRRGLLDAIVTADRQTIRFVNNLSRLSAKRDKEKITKIKQIARDSRHARRSAVKILNKELKQENKRCKQEDSL
ncbi:hypothetical protein NADFUDRAFT_42438 [Nadsonia fulvescens var. elongata DSM 6958]|uniref:Uncharacterized protein n=1 Tax=Nadsonia fulvescens var. elongata DSM 6958 TaxID=857566 RepID=A0A1E3PI85_9ASCO|nr:hypothetical protein NADFUDRAFT_42438 [Nadsonia fulvescens var. elongata DSM 6958]